MLTFRLNYFVFFMLLFITEVMIAAFVHDAFIRPFFGDFLAVIGVYFFLKSFLLLKDLTIALLSLGFAYFLELLQYLNFLAFSGLEKYKLIVIVLGRGFDWRDILAYTLGIITIFLFPNINSFIQRVLPDFKKRTI